MGETNGEVVLRERHRRASGTVRAYCMHTVLSYCTGGGAEIVLNRWLGIQYSARTLGYVGIDI